MKTLILATAAIIAQALYCVASTDQCILVQGSLTYKATMPGNSQINEEDFIFSVLTTPEAWKIALVPMTPKDYPVALFEAGFDGQDIYAYAVHNTNAFGGISANDSSKRSVNQGFAAIVPDFVPYPELIRAEALWLTYCSAYYFRTNMSGKARQIWPYPAPPGVLFSNILVKAKWEWLPGGRFLSHATYFNASDDGRELPHVTLAVDGVHELEGIKIPQDFVFVRFSEPDLASRRPLTSFQGTATNYSLVPAPADVRPQIKVPVMLADYRFQNDNPPIPVTRYLITNGEWPSKRTVASTKKFKIQKKLVAQESAGSPVARTVFVLLMLASVLAFAFAVLRRGQRS